MEKSRTELQNNYRTANQELQILEQNLQKINHYTRNDLLQKEAATISSNDQIL